MRLALAVTGLVGCGPHAPRPGGGGIVAVTCDVLGPTDFRKVGLDAAAPSDAAIGDHSHYCAYTPGKSGAQGGIELDLFVAQGDAADLYALVAAEAGPTAAPYDHALADTDESECHRFPSGTCCSARQGRVVLALCVPDGPEAVRQLDRLGAIVLARTEALQ